VEIFQRSILKNTTRSL